MPIILEMPALSPTMEKGNLVSWKKNEGDTIEVGDIIAEIETDKATMDVESVYKGTLAKIIISEGSKDVAVKTPIAIIRQKKDTDEDISNILKNINTSQESFTASNKDITIEEPTEKAQESNIQDIQIQNIKASPLAKRIANQKGIDLSSIRGSGPGGRIVKADIENMISTSCIKESQNAHNGICFEDIPVSGMRKVIAEKMTKAKRDVPHYYINITADVSDLINLRKTLNDSGIIDTKITVNDLIVKAVACAMANVPEINVIWNESTIRQFKNVDISVAVAIEGGIFTPVIRNADTKTVSSISKEIKELAALAKTGKLLPEQYTGGTITISNLGKYEIDSFTSILNLPQVSILSVAQIKKIPIVKNDNIEIGNVISMCLAIDHRAIDGTVAANFMQRLKNILENPCSMLA